MCYESSNVELVIASGGLKPLISFLVAPDPALQASASDPVLAMQWRTPISTPIHCEQFTRVGLFTKTRTGYSNYKNEEVPVGELFGSLKSDVFCPVSDVFCPRRSGALQSICFQSKGRVEVRELGGIKALVKLLGSSDDKVQTRAVGALHNISSDAQSIVLIREVSRVTS